MAFNYIAGTPDGYTGTKEHRDIGREKAQTQVPKDERRWEMHGGLEMSLQVLRGLCNRERKCIFREGHEGGCWPS